MFKLASSSHSFKTCSPWIDIKHGNFPFFLNVQSCLTLWDFKFSRRRVWCSELSSGFYCRVNRLSTDVSIYTAVQPRRQLRTSLSDVLFLFIEWVSFVCLHYTEQYFWDRSALSEGRKSERHYETIFPGIDITNTSPSPTELWVTMRSGTYFLSKNSTD
jgi:hypothetical protein